MTYVYSDGIYTLTDKYTMILKYKGKIIRVRVPKGFSWNGITGFRTTKKTLMPSMVHDWLIFDERINNYKGYTRKEMDEIFIILCKMNKVYFFELSLFRIALFMKRNVL